MRGRPLRAAALLATTLLAGCSGAFSSSDDGSGSSSDGPLLTTTRCADLVVIGARGSTQALDKNLGVGTEVRRTVTDLARRLHDRTDLTIRLEAVRYDSSEQASLDGYQSNVRQGADMVRDRLDALATACPDSRFALIGFSQGAQVMHTATVDVPTDLARRIPLLAMIADPRHDPADRITQFSFAASPVRGNGRLGAGSPIDPDLRGAAIAVCVEGDEICNDQGAPGGPPSDTHKHFYEDPEHAAVTAAQLDRVLRRNDV